MTEYKLMSCDDTDRLAKIVHTAVFDRSDLGWVNPPVIMANGTIRHDDKQISGTAALEVMTQKLNNAYSERLLMTLAYIRLASFNGVHVSLIQHGAHDGAPFDSMGWVIIVIGELPMFHISPDDLPLDQIGDLVYIVPPDQRDDPRWSWKGTSKKQEYAFLLGSTEE